MKDRSPQQRIGILDFTSPGWTAGSTFTRVMAWSLARACQGGGTEVVVFSEDDSKLAEYKMPVSVVRVSGALLGAPTQVRPSLARRVIERAWGRPDPSTTFNAYIAAREEGVSVLLPPGDVPDWTAGVKTLGWIPDFQHRHLPQLFSEQERRNRDVQYRRLIERAHAVLLSSHVAQVHFADFAPDLVSKARVASFPSVFAFEAPSGDPASTRHKYHLPEKFALVANQLWAHKNHELVVEGLRRLHRKGVRIPVVMTGIPRDHRDPGNRVVSRLLQGIASGGLSGQVVLMGEVSREELVDLMRAAALIIQPSRFEGWSTVVQDAKALGRPLICSDIPVHREQAPGALGWFPCDAPDVLADVIASHWEGLNPGPDMLRERKAMLVEQEFAAQHGRVLLGLCRDAVLV
ncbi:MAG: glycosyltransferase [Nitrospira sp.]|nr:glycosyltransferase [Nitrospira sp.]